jgi:hypothetical protein
MLRRHLALAQAQVQELLSTPAGCLESKTHRGVSSAGSVKVDASTEMTNKPATTRKTRAEDRRSGEDRRLADVGPPGKRDRRRSLEARKPDVVELDMSSSEWGALSQEPSTPDKK